MTFEAGFLNWKSASHKQGDGTMGLEQVVEPLGLCFLGNPLLAEIETKRKLVLFLEALFWLVREPQGHYSGGALILRTKFLELVASSPGP